ncbi:hypothetical protein Cch01nite_36500 [Cellulomonas chitinilytica]|uniref:NfeD-like C-terminal domain-containing protein n=1 Tax=Cellulomonas chitinilytica TaxID=398759 RepID=A0A919U339_9CELL|nr:hypothetical protein [Cellulomonas chitinilytica]GIG22926.1 hypothetical protein Cch01nite_36500 [Cellulomonas chitinilytica]
MSVLIFVAIAGIALALLLVTVLVGDFLDGTFDAIGLGDGFLSSEAVLSFFATFGLTGAILLASTDVSMLMAALAGLGAGAVVGGGAAVVTRALANGPTAHQLSAADYVDQVATVTTSIPADGMGQVHLVLAGQSTSIAARAAEPITNGSTVRIATLLGPGVVKVVREG